MWTVSRSWLPRTRIDAPGRQAPSGRTPGGECQLRGRKDCEDGQSLLQRESGAVCPGRALGPARVDDEAGTCPASVIAHRSSSEERRTITVAQRRAASFFFLGCLFFGQSKDLRTAQGFADALDTRGRPYPHVICSFCAQASEVEVNHFQEGEIG